MAAWRTAAARASDELNVVDEREQALPAPDGVTKNHAGRSMDECSIDICSIGRLEVADKPFIAIWREFSVAATHTAVGERDGLGRSAKELGLARGEWESSTTVWALNDFDGEHGKSVAEHAS